MWCRNDVILIHFNHFVIFSSGKLITDGQAQSLCSVCEAPCDWEVEGDQTKRQTLVRQTWSARLYMLRKTIIYLVSVKNCVRQKMLTSACLITINHSSHRGARGAVMQWHHGSFTPNSNNRKPLGNLCVYIVHARWSHASHTFIQAHRGRRWNQLVFGAAGGRRWGSMMVFAAALDLARVSHSPQAVFRPALRSAAQQGQPVEIQGQEHMESNSRQAEGSDAFWIHIYRKLPFFFFFFNQTWH